MEGLPYGARVGMEPAELRLILRLVDDAEGAASAGNAGFAEDDSDDVDDAPGGGADGTAGEARGTRMRTISFDPREGSRSDETGYIGFSFDGEQIELSLIPSRTLEVEMCSLKLRHAFSAEEQVLLNGYQSWTDTVERPAWLHMRGLLGVPLALVDRFALDGGGDYRFQEYTGIPGQQHGYTYATFRRDVGMVLVGSLDESAGFTKISIDANHGYVGLATECPSGELAAGKRVVLGRYAIVRGEQDECYDRYFELAGKAARPAPGLVGYSSWYRHYNDITEEKLVDDLAGLTVMLPPLLEAAGERAAGRGHGQREVTKLFQIDDGYCKVGDWLDIDRRIFPNGLAPFADATRAAGFLPGLWVAPFVCERGSRLFTEHPDWLLRDEAGEPVSTGSHWSGGVALDTRNTEVRSYVLEVLQTMVGEWGFGLLKLDFLYAACLLPHDGLNRGQLMADAAELLRLGAGDACLILGCGVPLAPAFGVFDYCRIGCDVGLDWDGPLYMRALHRERVSTKNSLANTYGRSPLDGRAFGNDPDVFFLRGDVKLTPGQRDELLFADADLGSVFLTSDNMGEWDEFKRKRYVAALSLFLEKGQGR